MLRVVLLVLGAAVAFAQTPPATPEKAPPEVDAALRARISQFYQFEVQGKYYQALQLVAEETRDLYVGSDKASAKGFEISSIRYSDDFTKADVIVLVQRLLAVEGFMGHPLPVKEPSHWKLENGQWCYFAEPWNGLHSPFGRPAPPRMSLPAGGPPGASRPQPPPPGKLPNQLTLTVDKPNVRLKSSGPSSEQVAISNPSPWPMALSLSDPKIAGLTVNLDRMVLKPGEKAILSIQSNGGAQITTTPITVAVKVQQTNQIIPIKVSFAN